jgi:hypothetical protein
MKETFIVRTEWYDAISELSNEDQLAIFQNMFHFHMDNQNLINLNNLSVKLVWKLILPNIERNINLYDKRKETSRENGLKGGRPSKNQQDSLIPTESEKPNKPNPETYYPNETLLVPVSVPVSVSVPEIANDFNPDAALVFERFRKLYPGDKRGHDTELAVLKKHKDWKAVLPTLEEILSVEIEYRHTVKKNTPSTFIPEWPHLSTYLKQRRWEVTREESQVSLEPKKKSHPYEGADPVHLQLKFNDYAEYLRYCEQYNVPSIPQAY